MEFKPKIKRPLNKFKFIKIPFDTVAHKTVWIIYNKRHEQRRSTDSFEFLFWVSSSKAVEYHRSEYHPRYEQATTNTHKAPMNSLAHVWKLHNITHRMACQLSEHQCICFHTTLSADTMNVWACYESKTTARFYIEVCLFIYSVLDPYDILFVLVTEVDKVNSCWMLFEYLSIQRQWWLFFPLRPQVFSLSFSEIWNLFQKKGVP